MTLSDEFRYIRRALSAKLNLMLNRLRDVKRNQYDAVDLCYGLIQELVVETYGPSSIIEYVDELGSVHRIRCEKSFDPRRETIENGPQKPDTGRPSTQENIERLAHIRARKADARDRHFSRGHHAGKAKSG